MLLIIILFFFPGQLAYSKKSNLMKQATSKIKNKNEIKIEMKIEMKIEIIRNKKKLDHHND